MVQWRNGAMAQCSSVRNDLLTTATRKEGVCRRGKRGEPFGNQLFSLVVRFGACEGVRSK
jgi:hypothetical protein